VIVAIAVFELVYVNKPLLVEVGAIISKDASPNVFVGTAKLVITAIF
jgi:hypothetical protein